MRQVEDFMNWLTDMDWGWWPVVSLRPQKKQDIDNSVLLKISPVFGTATGLIPLLCFSFLHMVTITATKVASFYALGCVIFFVGYKFSFAYFWNRRARRFRSQAQQESVA